MRALVPMLVLAAALGCTRGAPPPTQTPAATPQPKAQRSLPHAEKVARAIAALRASYVTENERWTPALERRVAALADADYRTTAAAIDAVLASPHRVPGNAARDEDRRPKETLLFFGVRQDARVVEMFPGGGWYTEILAPLLRKRGKLIVPAYDPNGPVDSNDTYVGRGLALLLGKSHALFGAVERVQQVHGQPLDLGSDESADVVLALDEMHNWVRFGTFDQYVRAAHAVLVPGGVFGVVQHRARPEDDPVVSANRGYLPETWVIEQIEAAGFRLVEKTELNANPKDKRDHTGGVRALATIDSDRMTLRFQSWGGRAGLPPPGRSPVRTPHLAVGNPSSKRDGS